MTLASKVYDIGAQSQRPWLAAFVGCHSWRPGPSFLIRFFEGFRARFTRVFQIARPSVWPSVEQIVGVVHVPVRLALERNVQVGAPAHRQANEPLDDVEEIEKYKSQFNHLSGMDALMLDKVGRDGRSLAAKQHSQNVDGVIIFEGYQSVVNDEHGSDVNKFCVFTWFIIPRSFW